MRLVEQGEYQFHYTLTLQPRDINYGGHMGYDALVSLVGVARVHMFRSLGFTELNLGDDQTGMLMSDLSVSYKAEAFMFDELQIDTHIGEFSRRGFRIFHRVKKGETIVALVETGMVTFNHKARKIAPVPETFLNALAQKK